jgi:hypothetical protein
MDTIAKRRGRRNRQRGQEGEREVAHTLTDLLGQNVSRLLGQERDGGADIYTKPFRWEIKRRKRIALVYDWLEEAQQACQAGDLPVVAMRGDGEKWLVVMRIEQAVMLMREEIANGKV